MQLSRLYSNFDNKFTPIEFNRFESANRLNVVFAKVTKPKDRDHDSHNLGKTTLLYLLDFCFLRNISGDDSFFLNENRERFLDFVFYLEVGIRPNSFVTIRRAVREGTKIALKQHELGSLDLRSCAPEEWDHWDVALEPARALLDSYLGLRAIEPWDFRKGISYFLRSQADYNDFFQIEKFQRGKDRDWKPYLARVFGLDYGAIESKYDTDATITDLERRRNEKEAEAGAITRDRGELVASIDILRDQINSVDERLDRFDFSEEERRIGKKVIDDIERRVSAINGQLYDVNVDIEQVGRSITAGIKFDLDRIREIYDQCNVILPDSLVRDYEELVDFNKRITRERNAALKERLLALTEERDLLGEEQDRLNIERQHLMAIVRNADSFRKYKELQGELADQRAKLSALTHQLKMVDDVAAIETRLRDLKAKRGQIVAEIQTSLQRDNPLRTKVTTNFSRYVRQVLGIDGKFIISQNQQGNIEFEIKTQDRTGSNTSQGKGKSYKQLLCALFDLAVLKALEDAPFYHFVYHDGVFEGLDNRKKLNLLDLLRTATRDRKIQYILSIIDTDLPRDLDTEAKLYFPDEEIIVNLSDAGDDGRLFRVGPF